MSIITNFKNLATNPIRKKAFLIAEAGYAAIDIAKIVNQIIKLKDDKLSIRNAMLEHSTDLDNYKKVFLIGIGKGSALACTTLAKILGKKLTKGIVLDIQRPNFQFRPSGDLPQAKTISNFQFLTGTHPIPSIKNVIATKKIIDLAKNASKDDLIITFICGGGSALLCGSNEELKYSKIVFSELTMAGADILELNTVRKHLSEIKAGGLAKIAYPATVVSLIVSDVIGNDLSMVASGPTVHDKTFKKDAEKIIRKYQHKSANLSALISVLKETPKDKKYFKKVENILFLSNREPILAMAEKAKEIGFKPKIYSLKIHGEAKNALLPLLKELRKGEILLAAGETTVTLKSQISNLKSQKLGKGGRNMEAVLGAIAQIPNSKFQIPNDLTLLSLASDGRDNTEAAGAIGDTLTLKKARGIKLNLQNYLIHHNSFNFFKKTDDLVFTKPKTFNVSDLMLILK